MIDSQEEEEARFLAAELEWVEHKCPPWLPDSGNIHEIQASLPALLSQCVFDCMSACGHACGMGKFGPLRTRVFLFTWARVSVRVYSCACHFDSHPHEYADQFSIKAHSPMLTQFHTLQGACARTLAYQCVSQSLEYCALIDGGVRVGLCVRVSCFHECLLWSWGRKTHAISLIRHKHIYSLLWI